MIGSVGFTALSILGGAVGKGGASAPTSPVTGMSVWADFTDPSTLFADSARTTPATSGGPLLGVTDKSGSNNNLTGVATTLAPSNGGAVMDGAAGYFSADSAGAGVSGINKPYTIFAVTEPSSDTNGTQRCIASLGRASSANPNSSLVAASGASVTLNRRSDTAAGSITVSAGSGWRTPNGTREYWIISFDGTNTKIIYNGFAQEYAAAIGFTQTMTVDQIGIGVRRRNVNDLFFLGKYREFIMYPSALSDADILATDAYIRNKHFGEAARVKAQLHLSIGQSNEAGQGEGTGAPSIAAGKAFITGIAGGDSGGHAYPALGEPFGNANVGSYRSSFVNQYYTNTGIVTFWVTRSKIGTALQPIATTADCWDVIYGQGTLAQAAMPETLLLHERLKRSPRYNYADQGITVRWTQGEADSSFNGTANVWNGNYSAANYTASLIALYNYINSQVPVRRWWTCELGSHRDGSDESAMALIRGAQASAMASVARGAIVSTLARNFKNQVPNTPWYLNGTDNTHYSQLGYNTLGVDMANNAVAILAGEAP